MSAKDSGFGRDLVRALLVSMVGGESVINERVEHHPRTMAAMPIAQGAAAALGLAVVFMAVSLAGLAVVDMARERWTMAGLQVAGALVLGVPALALTWRTMADLLVPYGRKSPAETALLGMLPQALDLDTDTEAASERVIVLKSRAAAPPTKKQQKRARSTSFGEFVALLPRRGLAWRNWEGSGVSRSQYNEWRDRLVAADWARWKSIREDGIINTTQGWELTASVREILQNMGA